MSFLLIALAALVALGLLAALLSAGDSDEPVVRGSHDCASCVSHDDGSCKIACLMEEQRKHKEKADAADGDGKEGGEEENSASPVAPALLLLFVLLAASCSTQKNTGQTRFWHAFTARYNTYFNASQAFIEGCEEQERGNRDDYTQLLPLYAVGNRASQTLGNSHFDRTIEKSEKAIVRHSIKRRPEWNKQRRKTKADIEWLNRREYNPFLWRAWLLLGKAQFHEGHFEDGAATFGYMARLYQTQPVILARARAWQAKCYAEMGWHYETEDLITSQRRDSIPRQAMADWDFTLADHYLRTGQYAEAAGSLSRCIRHERRRQRRARLWYILGQVEQQLGNGKKAFDAYRRVIRLQPPYELEFQARIAQTSVMAATDARGMVRRLQRMAASDKNKDYLGAIHYAIGNIHLSQCDTLSAIASYEEGNRCFTRSDATRGALLLQLAQLYWKRAAYADARRCYDAARQLTDAESPVYKEVCRRAELLGLLVPLTSTVQLEDSLQRLAALPEDERLRIIDRHIAALKQAEREAAQPAAPAVSVSHASGNMLQSGWYFYNPQLVSQGRDRFLQQWGRRANEDDWRRSKRTAWNGQTAAAAPGRAGDAVRGTESPADGAAPADSQSLAPTSREYYLAQLPFTPEQKAGSDRRMREALLPAAVLMKDKVENLPLARRMFRWLVDRWPADAANGLAWYHLYLMDVREGRQADAAADLQQLQQHYPQSEWTQLLSSPHYAEDQRFGQHLEDSLYAATYAAFCQERYREVEANAQWSARRFPHGVHRPKFLFVAALSLLGEGRVEACEKQLQQVVDDYPDNEVTPLAGHILRGLQQGRRPRGTLRPETDIWRQHRDAVPADSTSADTLSTRRDVRFVFVLAFQPDSVNRNQLLYELARHNFTTYLVRNFEIAVSDEGAVHRLTVIGFRSYDEALQYARRLYDEPRMATRLKGCRRMIVSEDNLPLLGTRFSYEDYDRFYQETLAPVKTDTHPLLNRPDIIVGQPEETDEATDDRQLPVPPAASDQPVVVDFDDDFYR